MKDDYNLNDFHLNKKTSFSKILLNKKIEKMENLKKDLQE